MSMAAARFEGGEIREGEAISKIETKSDLPLSLSARLRIVPVIAADALGSPLPSFSRSLPPKRAGSMGKTGGKIRSRVGGTVWVSVWQGLRKVGKRAPNDATKTPTVVRPPGSRSDLLDGRRENAPTYR